LKEWGLEATTSGRNDIVVGTHEHPLKVSGAAYKLAPPRALHHGTLLIDVDMSALSGLLNPNKLKLASKGVASVSARVTNLKPLHPDINHQTVSKAVIAAFCREYQSEMVTPEILDHSFLQQQDKLNKTFLDMMDSKWRLGETPEFDHHLEARFESPSPWGTIDVHMHSKKGMIIEAKVFSDSLYPELMDALASALEGVTYDTPGIDLAMSKLQDDHSLLSVFADVREHLPALGCWLKSAL
jgi:lipoate-protein ligase A